MCQNFQPERKGGETMSLDAIRKIAEAEASAKQALQEATSASRQLIADAETNGRNAKLSREAQANADVKQLMQEAEATAATNTEEILHHAENQCAVLRARAESRLSEAADRIVERIVIS